MTGRPAQFGRSLLPEVSGKLIAQFASNLEAMIGTDAAAAVPESSTAENVAAENLAADAVAAQVKEAVPPAAAAGGGAAGPGRRSRLTRSGSSSSRC